MFDIQCGTPAPQRGSLDDMAELANVSGPGVGAHQVARRRAEVAHRLPVLGVEHPQEMLGEEQHVRSALARSEEHTSELQSPCNLVCRLLLEKKKKNRPLNIPPPIPAHAETAP